MNNKILNLVNAYKLLPGIGQKNAERLAFYTLEMDSEQIEYISNTIINTYKGVKKCSICNNYTDNENSLCDICIDEDRENKVLCIVEDPKIVYFMEKNKIFPGKYFVLNNLISPIEGIGPEDIGLDKLKNMLEANNISEIIIAIKSSIEGETTALYIKELFKSPNIKISKIASGIPMGADFEYIDNLTFEKAIEERKEI
jgi:recombination protein recR